MAEIGPWLGEFPSELLLLASAAIFAIVPVIKALAAIVKAVRDLWSVFPTEEKRRRAAVRRIAAEYIRNDIVESNHLDLWDDERYAELEAEIDAE